MPVTGEDALSHGTPIQRETHVGTAVVDGMHLTAVGKQSDDLPVQLHHPATGRFHLGQRSRKYIIGLVVHRNFLCKSNFFDLNRIMGILST